MKNKNIWVISCLLILSILSTLVLSCGKGKPTPTLQGQDKITPTAPIGTLNIAQPAEFQTGSVDIVPREISAGDSITVNVEVKNSGGTEGKYTAKLSIDGKEAGTREAVIGPASSKIVTFSAKMDTSGAHSIEVGGINKTITVMKPAGIQVNSIKVTPQLVFPGQETTVEADVTNSGEVKGNIPVALKINGEESDSQMVSLDPGKTGKASFKVSRDTGGKYDLKIGEMGSFFDVAEVENYTNKSFYYSLVYPSDWVLDDENLQQIDIGNQATVFTNILASAVPSTMSQDDFLSILNASNKRKMPNIQIISQKAIEGYRDYSASRVDYQYSDSNINVKASYIAMKSQQRCFVVTCETLDTAWESNQSKIEAFFRSFIPPVVVAGSYTDTINGYSISLPSGWDAVETGRKQAPLAIQNPFSQPYIRVNMEIDPITQDKTEIKDFAEDLASEISKSLPGYKLLSQSEISLAGIKGCKTMISYTAGSSTNKMRIDSAIRGSQAFSIITFSLSSTFDAQQSTIDQLVKSFTFVEPKPYGVSKQDSLFVWQGDIVTLDPAACEDAPDDIIGAIFSGLVRIDKDLKVVPDLAENWDVSKDGLTYTFHLRPNAKFQDGKPVTAQDVKFSWERALNPKTESKKSSTYLGDLVGAQEILQGKTNELSGVKVVDPSTLSVTIDGPKPYFLDKLAQPAAFIVDKTNVSIGSTWYKKPNGTGPFKIKQWDKDQLLILERNDSYYLEPAKLKNIVFKIYAGQPMIMYENGETDIQGASLSNLDRVTDTTNPLNKNLVTGKSIDVCYLGFNVTKAPFDDPKVRQAFALALDMEKLVEVSMKGQAERTGSLVPPGIPGYNADLKPFAFDAAQAKKLISESKYGSIDKLPPLTLSVPLGADPLEEAAVAMWKQNLGVSVQVETVTELKEYYQKKHDCDFQIFITGWRADYIDPQDFLEVLFRSGSDENEFGYSNPAVDAALKEAAVEKDTDARLKKYQDIEKMILNDLPAVPIYSSIKSNFLVKPYVKGFSLFPIAINIWRDISITSH
jgi:oligopeptide transport system substrate-binding protein